VGIRKTLKTITLIAGSIGLLSATPIVGTLNFTGSATVNLFGLDFAPDGGGNGQIRSVPASNGNTGSFAGLNDTSVGLILDRTEATQPVGVPLNPPNGINNYVTFPIALPNAIFRLDFILPGAFSAAQCGALPAPNQQCTPPPTAPPGGGAPIVSPYNLTNYLDASGQVSSNAGFSVRGTVINTLTQEVSTFNGTFTATFLNTPYQSTLSQVLGGGQVRVPFSATFIVTAIPEPSTLAMVGAFALIAGLKLRKRR